MGDPQRRLELVHAGKALVRLTGIQETIVVLAAAGGVPVRGRNWLQAEMFLISQVYADLGRESCYVASPHGPYSRAVEAGLEQLGDAGMVSTGDGGILLTGDGREAAAELKSRKGRDVVECIGNFKSLVNDMTRDELLCYACLDHPDMVEHSPEADRVVARAEDIVFGMVWREAISRGRAAELLDRSVESVITELSDRGYPIPL